MTSFFCIKNLWGGWFKQTIFLAKVTSLFFVEKKLWGGFKETIFWWFLGFENQCRMGEGGGVEWTLCVKLGQVSTLVSPLSPVFCIDPYGKKCCRGPIFCFLSTVFCIEPYGKKCCRGPIVCFFVHSFFVLNHRGKNAAEVQFFVHSFLY